MWSFYFEHSPFPWYLQYHPSCRFACMWPKDTFMFPTEPREHTAGSFYVCHFDELLGDGCHVPKQNHPLYLKSSSPVLLSTKFCQHWQSKINVFKLLNGDLHATLSRRWCTRGSILELVVICLCCPSGL